MENAMLFKALREFTTGLLNQLLVNLAGDDGDQWLNELKKFLRKEECWVKSNYFFKTIKLGTGLKTADDFREALKKGGNKISDWGNDILGKPDFEKSIAPKEIEVDLCVATTKELTGKDVATTEEIFKAIKRVGELCPAEVGPQLRLQYLDQPKGEWFRVAMEPIKDSGGALFVFSVVHGSDDRWLDARCGSPDSRWSADPRWVFVRRKS